MRQSEDPNQLILKQKDSKQSAPKKDSEVREAPVVVSEEAEAVAEKAEVKVEVKVEVKEEPNIEAVAVKAEDTSKEENTKVKVMIKFVKKVSTDQEAEVSVVVAVVKEEAVAEQLSIDPEQLKVEKLPSRVTRVKLLLIERKELIIEVKKIMDLRVSQEKTGTHMIEKMVLEEEEDSIRQAMVKEIGVMLRMKSKDRLLQLKKVLKLSQLKKALKPRLKKLQLKRNKHLPLIKEKNL
jgi:hypothetical protein